MAFLHALYHRRRNRNRLYLLLVSLREGYIDDSFPETKGRNLEEIDEIFNAKKPVEESLRRRQADLIGNENGAILVGHS